METRREFLKNAVLLSGTAGATHMMPEAIRKALLIDPERGSTYLDAEHVVLLMQENRSFDHCFGSLKGVRGFNDPRLITQPNGNVVWLQSNSKGETFSPFRFDIKDTKATWMGAVPHSRHSQVDAWNNGRYDDWIESKRVGNKDYRDIPLTMGFYNRKDVPFNYSLADAFTICDQNFCSAMTSTWPNRLYFWSGTVRNHKSDEAKAFIRNDIPWGEAYWKTFPERLEKNKISWKVYQNSLTLGGGLQREERAWLTNFTCNPLEYLSQYNARFFNRYYDSLLNTRRKLLKEIEEIEQKLEDDKIESTQKEKLKTDWKKKRSVLSDTNRQIREWNPENFDSLTEFQKNIHKRAFTINDGDPDYMKLEKLKYKDKGEDRELDIPKGDVLYQFRKDVEDEELPTVSWLVPPQNFSDHPSAPWFGAWYVSEILNILTKNPEVWKKTIFILTYDENDGYFDHIPPFVAPDPRDKNTGRCSKGLNESGVEFIRKEQEILQGVKDSIARTAPTGLGFRVPMIVASPWTRGGKVSSQIFDHTSPLQFLEVFLKRKFNKDIRENNISEWRRTITGDMTSLFDRFEGKDESTLQYINKTPFIKQIYNSKFKRLPNDFRPLTAQEIKGVNKNLMGSDLLPEQEKGTKIARPIPCQMYVNGCLNLNTREFELEMKVGNDLFGAESKGSPFKVYIPKQHLVNETTYKDKNKGKYEVARSWDFAVKPGDMISASWNLKDFKDEDYHLTVYGPNGFYRDFKGDKTDSNIKITCEYERLRLFKTKATGNLIVQIQNNENKIVELILKDESYKNKNVNLKVQPKETQSLVLDLSKNYNWYDFSIRVKDNSVFCQRFAGHVETGKESRTDPLMGKEI